MTPEPTMEPERTPAPTIAPTLRPSCMETAGGPLAFSDGGARLEVRKRLRFDAQDRPIEVLVVDDGPAPDNSTRVVEQFARSRGLDVVRARFDAARRRKHGHQHHDPQRWEARLRTNPNPRPILEKL